MATLFSTHRVAAAVFALCAVLGLGGVAGAQGPADTGTWHELPVPGGRDGLAALGVDADRERSAVMVELIRRLHFAVSSTTDLERALSVLAEHEPTPSSQAAAVTVPLPLSPTVWSMAVFQRPVVLSRLFTEILRDPSARLLFHGLAGLDEETRHWIGGQADLLQTLYRDADANRAFALFAPALRVAAGQVLVPGGDAAEQRWRALLDAEPREPARFIRRLFEHHDGRTAGLYFVIATAGPARQRFLLGTTPERFARLVASFPACYPANATAAYPFALRSHDAALLLTEVEVAADGTLAGPAARGFWDRVLDGEGRPGRPPLPRDLAAGDRIDAAWMAETLCAAASPDRGPVFTTILAAQRVFSGLGDGDLPDALVAVRSRRLYPAVFMALEHAGIRRPRTYAAVARHAAQLARLDHPERAVTALRQFQGLLALTLNATTASTVSVAEADALLESLAAVALEQDRYDTRLIEWFVQRWLPAVGARPDETVEEAVARALAGPPPAQPQPVHWEGLDYFLDFAAAGRQRLLEVRARQGGVTLDAVVRLNRLAAVVAASGPAAAKAELTSMATQLRAMTIADEFGGLELAAAVAAGDNLPRVIDVVFSHVLASWAYAPHLGDADAGALTGGDRSLRHNLGVRAVGRVQRERRWELPAAERGTISGSLLGLQAALGAWSLRRLSIDSVPAPPTIVGNDLTSLLLTAALSDPRRLTDGARDTIAAATAAGLMAVERAAGDPARLAKLASAAAMSPWRREVLSWLVAEEPARLVEQFSIIELARIGGLDGDEAHGWGAVSVTNGCLCLRMPRARIPEVTVGRAADGIVGGQSADLMLRIATILAELKMPASLAAPVLSYAMRDFLDAVTPRHAADFEAFAREARTLGRRAVEDYLGAIAAFGALRPVGAR